MFAPETRQGVYELTPLKQYFRRRCHERVGSGYEFGGALVSISWMGRVGDVPLFVGSYLALLPLKAAIDVPLTLAIIGLGILIVIAPSSVPGLTPPMSPSSTVRPASTCCNH